MKILKIKIFSVNGYFYIHKFIKIILNCILKINKFQYNKMIIKQIIYNILFA